MIPHSSLLQKTLLLIYSLLFSYAAVAESPQYSHIHYDDHSGMSQWHLTKVLQDGRGFMWFATWNGLNRFDGYDFAVFKSTPGDGNNLTSDRIRNMLIGEDGNIYCVNNDIVWRFNLHTYRFESVDPTLQERYLARMNYDTSVFKQPRTYTFGAHSFTDVRQMLQDNQKNYWLMGRFGVELLSPLHQPATILGSVPRTTVRVMFRDHKRRLWIGTRDGGTVTVLDSLANLIGYLGTDGTLHRTATSFAPTYAITQQRDGTIWIGTKPQGIFRLRETSPCRFTIDHITPGKHSAIKHGHCPNSNAIYDFLEDPKGRLWIATQGGGINILDNPSAPPAAMRFHNMNNTLTAYPTSAPYMRRIMLCGDSLVLATTTEGLLVIDNILCSPGKMRIRHHQRESHRASSLSCSATMDMLIDRKGRLFVSTESGGVNQLLTPNLRSPRFSFKHYDTDNGMGSDAALAMTEIGDEILIQCNNQVTRLNADLHTLENYNDLFFAMTPRFSDAEPLLLSDGRWLLSLEDGVLAVPEQTFHQRLYTPRIALTSFRMPDAPTDYSADRSDTLVLSPRQRDVTVSYAALDYSGNSSIKYVTRLSAEPRFLQSADSVAWSSPKSDRSIALYNLSPGTYTLEIRSTNAEGLWVDNVRRLTIIVEPRFSETIFAYLLYLLIAVLLAVALTYTVTYIRHLRRQREDTLNAYLQLINADPAPTAAASAPASTATPTATAGTATVTPSSAETKVIVPTTAISAEDDAFMRRLLQFVDENLGNSSVGVDEMARATATSRSSLNRRMKQMLGVTPADFLKEARMQRARQLLLTSHRSINDIAYACGFSDPKYFSKCFKASYAMSPTEYRVAQQEENEA